MLRSRNVRLVTGVGPLVLLLAVYFGVAAEDPANQHFFGVWQRTDQPVRDGQVTRTWMWGPEAFTPSVMEQYADSPGGQREVQYYDKSRMEITNPNGDSNSIWFVTNGLLVNELMTGQLQLGDNTFQQHGPAEVNVAGDADDVLGPTYSAMANLRNAPALPSGSTITQTVDRQGNVGSDGSFGQYNVTAANRVQVPGIDHQVASPFWDFMNATGLVIEDGQLVTADLFQNPYFATGFPVTEAYWSNLKVAGSVKAVLIQCFERRCLTYTPSNAVQWRVEQGNVGQHYYRWRYEQIEATPTAKPTPSLVPDSSLTIGFVGDLGGNSDSEATLLTLDDLSPLALFVAGDISYNAIVPESAWCDWVQELSDVPLELLVGNHEDDDGPDGFIRNFTACMPDVLGAVGDYGIQYYVDLPNARIIGIAPDLDVDGHRYRYAPGDADREWLEHAISRARADGSWVIAFQHKVCITVGVKSCEIGEELADFLAANVDVIMMGHDHNYQRSHQLTCIVPDIFTPACISDADGDHQQGDGALYIVSGSGGRDTPINHQDSEAGYFAAAMGEGDPGWGHGFTLLTVTADSIIGQYVPSTGTYTDVWVMRR